MDPSRNQAAGAYRPPSTNAILLHPWRFQSPTDLMALMDAYDLLPVDLTEAALRRRFSWSTPGELTRFIDRRQRPPVLYVAYGDLAASSGAVFAPGCIGREALVVKGAFTGGSGDPAINKPELAEAVWEHIWQRASQPALAQQKAPGSAARGVPMHASGSQRPSAPPSTSHLAGNGLQPPWHYSGQMSTSPHAAVGGMPARRLQRPPVSVPRGTPAMAIPSPTYPAHHSFPPYPHMQMPLPALRPPLTPSSAASSAVPPPDLAAATLAAPRMPNRHDRQAAIQRMRANVIRLVQSSESEGSADDDRSATEQQQPEEGAGSGGVQSGSAAVGESSSSSGAWVGELGGQASLEEEKEQQQQQQQQLGGEPSGVWSQAVVLGGQAASPVKATSSMWASPTTANNSGNGSGTEPSPSIDDLVMKVGALWSDARDPALQPPPTQHAQQQQQQSMLQAGGGVWGPPPPASLMHPSYHHLQHHHLQQQQQMADMMAGGAGDLRRRRRRTRRGRRGQGKRKRAAEARANNLAMIMMMMGGAGGPAMGAAGMVGDQALLGYPAVAGEGSGDEYYYDDDEDEDDEEDEQDAMGRQQQQRDADRPFPPRLSREDSRSSDSSGNSVSSRSCSSNSSSMNGRYQQQSAAAGAEAWAKQAMTASTNFGAAPGPASLMVHSHHHHQQQQQQHSMSTTAMASLHALYQAQQQQQHHQQQAMWSPRLALTVNQAAAADDVSSIQRS